MNDVNMLMSRIDEINHIENPKDLTDNDIETLIMYYRHQRQRKASGEKVPKSNKPVADLATLLGRSVSKPAPQPPTTNNQPPLTTHWNLCLSKSSPLVAA
jgi:hypothetical protein